MLISFVKQLAAVGLRQQGHYAFRRKNWARAAALYNWALRFEPLDGALWVQLGHAQKEAGLHFLAEQSYRTASQKVEGCQDGHLQLGHLFRTQARFEEAKAAYLCVRACLGDDDAPMRWELYCGLADLARDRRCWSEAAEYYKLATDTDQAVVPIWVQLGHAYKESGDSLAAEIAYRRAVFLDAKASDAFVQLGHLLISMGRRSEAIASYAAAIEISKDNFEDQRAARDALTAAVGYSPTEFAVARGLQSRSDTQLSAEFGVQGGVDIVWLSNIEWHFRMQRPQHLAKAVARKGARILYVSMLFDDAEKSTYRILEQPSDGIAEVRLACPSGERACLARGIDAHVADALAAALKAAVVDAGYVQPLIIVEEPLWCPLVKALGWPVVYDCVDLLAAFEDTAPERLLAERDVLDAADVVIVTSSELAKDLKHYDPILIRNGVDSSMFNRSKAVSFRSDRLILGYFGAIREWFAFDWLIYCADRNPEWEFWLIGRDERSFSEVFGRNNIKFMGERRYEDLPGYLAQFSVALIPFTKSELTQATNPVKLYEYLAGGKPVVAVDLPEIEAAGDLVYRCNDAVSFEAAIKLALAEDKPELLNKRVDWARENTWDARAALLLAALPQVRTATTG